MGVGKWKEGLERRERRNCSQDIIYERRVIFLKGTNSRGKNQSQNHLLSFCLQCYRWTSKEPASWPLVLKAHPPGPA